MRRPLRSRSEAGTAHAGVPVSPVALAVPAVVLSLGLVVVLPGGEPSHAPPVGLDAVAAGTPHDRGPPSTPILPPAPPVPDARPPLPLDRVDPGLQDLLEARLADLGLAELVAAGRLAVSLVDLGPVSARGGMAPDGAAPVAPPTRRSLRYAGVNDDRMMYAASLPKIAALLTAFEMMEEGRLEATPELERQLTEMIRFSSNRAATSVIRRVGFREIARCLKDPDRRLYEEDGAGGLWVGKAYDAAPARTRDPLHGLSHGASSRQAARFFALLATDRLLGHASNRRMLEMLGRPGIRHKFVRGLEGRPGVLSIHRKSGTYRRWHADAALVERRDRRYVLAALVEDPDGGRILERLAPAVDDLLSLRETTVGAEPGNRAGTGPPADR